MIYRYCFVARRRLEVVEYWYWRVLYCIVLYFAWYVRGEVVRGEVE